MAKKNTTFDYEILVGYMPRQDCSNGNIKDYEVQVSMDGKTWRQPVATGAFANDRTLKRVIFDKPVRARYLRFTAKSSQDGQDFASCAEFNVLEQQSPLAQRV